MQTDQAIGSRYSLTIPGANSSESTDLQSVFDWLTQSGSKLLSDIAHKLQTNQEIDYLAVESHMLSSFHWSAVQRCIAVLESATGNTSSQSNERDLGVSPRGNIAGNSIIEMSDSRQSSPDLHRESSHDNHTLQRVGEGNESDPLKTGEEKYPNFFLPNEATGHAYIDDFSPEDLARLRTLAHLELAAQFEQCGLQPKFQPLPAARPASPSPRLEPALAVPKSPKSKRKASGRCGSTSAASNNITDSGGIGGCWFGVSLETVLAMERAKLNLPPDAIVEGHPVPQLVNVMISRLMIVGLEEEGILRVSGSHQNIRAMKAQIDAHGPDAGIFESADAHDISGLLKTFLRELPQPLLGGPYTDYYRQIDRLPSVRQRLIGISLLVLLLEPNACHTLRAVVDFMGRVLECADKTRMTLRGLATVMTPSLMPTELTSTLSESERVANIVEMMVKYRKIAWRVPRTLVKQLRDSADTDCAIFRGFPAGGAGLQVRSSAKMTIAALPACVSITYPGQEPQLFKLESDTTIASLLDGVNLPDAQVYEVGGNVNRRRLPKAVELGPLLAANPRLSLVVKSR